MKRLSMLLAAVLIAAAVAAVAVAAGRGEPRSGRTIRLVERGGSFTFVDNAPKGNAQTRLLSAGDLSAGAVKLYEPSGQRAGSLHIVCIATVGGQEVHAKFE